MTTHVPRIKSRVALHAHRRIRGLLEGEYASAVTGRSLDFNDLREYVRGDDVKDLDWKASARSGTLLVKRYAAVRKHTVILAMSTGRSMAAHNDQHVSKRQLATFAAGMVGWLAVRNGDRVAMTYGSAARQSGLPPNSGEMHLERCLAAAFDDTTPDSPPTDLVALLRHVADHVRRRGILLVVGDDTEIGEEAARLVRRLAVQHEVLWLTVGDIDPTSAPADALDIDTRRRLPDWISSDRALMQAYADAVAAESTGLGEQLDVLGVVHGRIHDEPSAISTVFRLLERHRHARRR